MKRKILTLAGTRPELIRLSSLIPELDAYFDHFLVHTGQNPQKEMKDVFFDDLGIRDPDILLALDTSSVGKSLANLFAELERVFTSVQPEAVIALGDTNSALGLLLAKRMGMLTYHLEAGNRSFDDNVPEEVNRRTIDHFSDFNLCYTEHARTNLLREGISPRFIAVTGSPIPEVARRLGDMTDHSKVLQKYSMEPKSYLLASIHRQETLDNPTNFQLALRALEHAATQLELDVVVSGHPRFMQRVESAGKVLDSRIKVHSPFGYREYFSLQRNAICVISDSGTVSEESVALGFPAVTLRTSMERPEALERGCVMLTGLGENDLTNAIAEMISSPMPELSAPDNYLEQHFSKRVLRFIASTVVVGRDWKNLNSPGE